MIILLKIKHKKGENECVFYNTKYVQLILGPEMSKYSGDGIENIAVSQ